MVTPSPNAIPNSLKATLRVTLPHFAANSSTLTASMKVNLVKLAASMVKRTVSSMTLTGNTDTVGSRAAHLALGRRRAKAVAAFLRQQLKVDRCTRTVVVNVKTRGRARWRKPNTTVAGRTANSRVIVVAISK